MMNSSMCAAYEHEDLRQNNERPDATETIFATALCSHGNSGAVSATDTDVDN